MKLFRTSKSVSHIQFSDFLNNIYRSRHVPKEMFYTIFSNVILFSFFQRLFVNNFYLKTLEKAGDL